MTTLTVVVALVLIAAVLVVAHRLTVASAALVTAANRLRDAGDALESAQAAPCFAVMPRMFDLQSAAIYLGLSTDDVYALVHDGRLRHVAGDPPRFSRAALDEALDLGLGPRATTTRGAA